MVITGGPKQLARRKVPRWVGTSVCCHILSCGTCACVCVCVCVCVYVYVCSNMR